MVGMDCSMASCSISRYKELIHSVKNRKSGKLARNDMYKWKKVGYNPDIQSEVMTWNNRKGPSVCLSDTGSQK